MTPVLLALLLAAPPPAPEAPPPPASPRVPVPADEPVWLMARKANSVAAYRLYLRRYPQGSRSREAAEALARTEARPLVHAPPPLPGERPRPLPPPQPIPFGGPCYTLVFDQRAKRADRPEGLAYLAATGTNRLADYRAFLAAFPAGACSAPARAVVEAREAILRELVPVPGLGPLPPHRAVGRAIVPDDYPVGALRRKEEGVVTAEWDVAEDGMAESCRIVRSSGSATLDEATCRHLVRRMRYDPARDAAGRVVRSVDRAAIAWRIPEEPPRRPSPRG